MGKLDLRQMTTAEREALREEVLRAIAESWMRPSVIARRYGLDRRVVLKWMKRTSGLERKRGRPDMKVLYDSHQAKVLSYLHAHDPCAVGSDDPFWSVASVSRAITQHVEVKYSEYLVRKVLARWGFSLTPSRKSVFNKSNYETQNLPLIEFARKTRRRCFLILTIRPQKTEFAFTAIFSPRGDVRFISWNKAGGRYPLRPVMDQLEQRSKTKLIIIYDWEEDQSLEWRTGNTLALHTRLL